MFLVNFNIMVTLEASLHIKIAMSEISHNFPARRLLFCCFFTTADATGSILALKPPSKHLPAIQASKDCHKIKWL